MSNGPEDSTAADWNVELSADTADRAEELLRDLATDAELEMAVVVERSGGMIAGVATRQDVDVSTVSALVAGAFGAMGALANELGESHVRESLHQGSGDTVYLREVGERFVLLGVAPSSLPSGLIREKGAQVADKLTALLNGTEDATGGEEAEESGEEPSVPVVESEPAPAVESGPEPESEPSPFQSAETGPVSPQPVEGSPAVGTVHTEISVEDEDLVSMPSLDPAVRGPEVEQNAQAPASPPAPKEKPGESPTYVFEIG